MLKRNIISNYLGGIWTAFMGLAFLPLYIQYLGVEAFGLIGLFAAMQAWLILLDMGMAPTLNREMARYSAGTHSATSIRSLLRTMECIAMGLALLIAGGVALGAEWMAGTWLKTENLSTDIAAQSFTIMGIVIALRFVEGIYRSCIIGLEKQVLFNVVNSTMATLRSLGAIAILHWISPTIQAFFIWQGLISFITLIILAGATYVSLPRLEKSPKFSVNALKGVSSFASGMIGNTVLSTLLMQIDKLLLSNLLKLSEYGYYTLAAVVAGGTYSLVSPITQALSPRISQLCAAGDRVGLVRAYHQGAQLVSVALGGSALVLIVFAETFLQLWTQDETLASSTAPLLRLLVLGNLLNGLMWMPYQTQLAYGWTGLSVRINVVALLIIIPTLLYVAPKYGAEGAACVWVGLNVGYLLIGVHFMYRRILTDEKWRWYLQDLAKPLITATAVALLISWLIPPQTSLMNQFGILLLATVLTMGAACIAAEQIRIHLFKAIARILNIN